MDMFVYDDVSTVSYISNESLMFIEPRYIERIVSIIDQYKDYIYKIHSVSTTHLSIEPTGIHRTIKMDIELNLNTNVNKDKWSLLSIFQADDEYFYCTIYLLISQSGHGNNAWRASHLKCDGIDALLNLIKGELNKT